ncbi:MAG: lamin tail domain-containing protein, partial [Myxococcota bacterium]|nr:lamin tail domain-containing protein [Myxococcota bacterium]
GAVIDTVRYGASRDGESWNRASDGTPGAALIPHGEVEGATEPQSPGTLANGRGFLEGPRFELVINEVMPDPVGRDRGQEYVEIVNLGPDAAPLEGITLSDGNGLRHRFGPEMLAAGRALVLFDQGDHAGIPGASSATTGFLSLNNTGDTLTMSSRDGELMDFVAWDDAGPGESWTRAEDGNPGAPLVLHGDVSPDGRLASPGTRLDGSIW